MRVVGLTVEIDARMSVSQPSLPIRAGLASGPVIMFEGDDYIGYPVNVAARLCDQARPHQLLATVEVAGARPEWVAAEPATSVVVRGLSREVATRTLFLQDPGPGAVVDPVCGLTIAPRAGSGVVDGSTFCSDACADAFLERFPPDVAVR